MTREPSDFLPRAAGALWILAVAWLGMWLSAPHGVVPESAPPTEFSAVRAMRYIREIARAPHPVGSADHARVRDYLLHQLTALGLEPTVGKTVAMLADYGVAATVENVLARKRGTSAGPAVLLVAHYDSVPAGPGAGDDGAGVATLLETARALGAGPPLRHDVIFLFSDGEELGLLGASAFAAEHPWKQDVAAVLNFDNRGTRGAVLMYETSPGNLALVRDLASAVPAPRASSLSAAVARLMPNSTDFYVLRKAGLAGLNFAFIGAPQNYHTRQDSPENVDLRTLQQSGNDALPLARRLADADLSQLARVGGANAVYFNPAGNWLVVYPEAWARPFAIGVLALFLLVAAVGFVRAVVRVNGVLLALLLCVLSLLAAWRAADWMAVYLPRFHAYPGNVGPYLYHPVYAAALACLVAGLTFALWEIGNLRWEEIALAGTGVWTAAAMALSFRFPEASYLAVWPLVPILAVLGIALARPSRDAGGRGTVLAVLAWLSAVPTVLLLAPLLPSVQLALGISALGAPGQAVIVALSLWLLASVLAPCAPEIPGRVARLSLIFLVAGAALLAFGLATVRYNDQHPRPEWMAYVQDADDSTSQWMSEADTSALFTGIPHVDPWRTQYLTATPITTYSPIPLPGRANMMCWSHPAPRLDLTPPAAEVLSDTRKDSSRELRIVLHSPPGVARLTVQAEAQKILALRLNGREVGQRRVTGPAAGALVMHGAPFRPREQREIWSLLYAAPPAEGLEIEVAVPAGSPVELTVADISDGLPAISGRAFSPRPPSVTARQLADMTVVIRSFTF
jgi:Peptidase family M28